MQIVIDIDENVFTRLFDNGIEDYEIVNDDLFAIAKSIRKGIPLPEHHGRLADLDAALKCVEEVTDCKEKEYAIALFDWAMSKRVIIPATKEGE